MPRNPANNPRTAVLVRALDVQLPSPTFTDGGVPKFVAADSSGILLTRAVALNASLGDVVIPAYFEADSDDFNQNIPYQPVISANYGFSDAANGWDRLRSIGTDSDSIATSLVGSLNIVSNNAAFNGATFDRLRCAGNNADAVTPDALGILKVSSFAHAFNGSGFDRVRAVSTANMTGIDGAGAILSNGPAQWTATAAAAANTISTATRAAQGAGSLNIIQSITVSAASSTQATTGPINFVLRAGVGGTILWQCKSELEARNTFALSVSGLNISVGDNVAAVLTTVTQPGTGVETTVSMSGITST